MDSIYRFNNFNIWQNNSISLSLAYKGKSSDFGQIAFDYISNNLYWCDSLHKWIAMKPAYSDNDTIYKVVVQKDLYQPEGLALDPEDGLMFFSDNQPTSRIERVSMDGRDRTAIVYTSLLRIFSLSVDETSNLLYWADHDRHTLEVSDYNGLNRRVIRRSNNVPVTGLHYYQNVLHVVSAETRSIFGVDITSGLKLYHIRDTDQPFTIDVYDAESTRSYPDPCSSRGCQHICVNTPTGGKCLCAEGYLLSSDGRSCTDRSFFHEKGFIISNGTHFAMVEVQVVSGGERRILVIVPFAIIETFAVDATMHLIYYLDSSRNALQELNLIHNQIRTLATAIGGKDLIFDWIANLLAWIEPTQSRIRAFSINSGTTSVIYTGLQQPSSLSVDAHNGDLYWISGTSKKEILRGNWNRNSPKVIVSHANLNNPISLQYDVISHRIYWLDNSMIKSSMTNGSDIQSHVNTYGATQAFAYKDYFGWINGNKTYFAKKSAVYAEFNVDVIQNTKQIAIFDTIVQQDRRSSCQILNGGCDEICVPFQNGRVCECDFGLQLHQNLTCKSSVYSLNFLIVSDYSHGRILQVDITTGNMVKLPINVQNSPGITFDKSTMEIFYSELSTKTIMSTTLLGKNKSLIYATGFAHATRLTIDYSTGNIYFIAVASAQNQGYIGVVHRKSFLQKTLWTNLQSPSDLVVYPSKGFLFWIATGIGNVTELSRSYMDGTFKTNIATTNIGRPNGLAIDYTANRLYWTDGLKNSIEYSGLNGENKHVLTTDTDAHLMSILVHGQYIYYTAWNRQSITKLDKTTGVKHTFMANHPELGRLDSLDIYADDSVDVNAICSKKNGNCSTFCFPTPTGRTCGCQDNVNLQSDQTTCQGVSRCTTSLQNAILIDCFAYPEDTCEFGCKPGFRRTLNVSATCNSFGEWTPSLASLCAANSQNLVCTEDGIWNLDTNNLCRRSTCSKTLKNGQLIGCRAHLGETCQYKCASPFEINPSFPNITCNTSGEWSHNTEDLCVQLCVSTIPNGTLGSDCQRVIGNNCSFTCDMGYESSITSSHIICTSNGTWNKMTDELCKRKKILSFNKC
ncbi:low-density lipoprotein receptor-related protein 6-like [Saccostrea cucullata]|uniref:low-density lipoprotein receptor-related protein 6-like n=1 Tax=Saccostrea cuccullata TaxID=36930 RepID=UPI002ED25B94